MICCTVRRGAEMREWRGEMERWRDGEMERRDNVGGGALLYDVVRRGDIERFALMLVVLVL
jgi:hypothetical protein